jgi:hypothetical protein
MYDIKTRNHALALMDQGLTVSEVSRRTGVSRWAIRDWRLRIDQNRPLYSARIAPSCVRCETGPEIPAPVDRYAYLLGLYLGDGYLSPSGDPAKGVWSLRIFCADAYPGLKAECAQAMRAIHRDSNVNFVAKIGCTEIKSASRHWPCLFPQHGQGMKHTRKIALEPWQHQAVSVCTEEFVRGLIHSDGSRSVNRVKRALTSGEHWYEYPRYLFSNESIDILRLFTDALDRLGVEWKQSNKRVISVAKKEAVARLDEFVGPKY